MQLHSIDGSSGPAWCANGDVLLDMQRYDDALFAYYKPLPLQKDKMTTLIGIVRGLLGGKHYAEALGMIDHLEQAAPDTGFAWHYRGAAFTGLEQYEEAVDALRRALERGVGNLEYDTWLLQGYAQIQLGHDEEALAAYEQAIRLRPRDMRGWEGKLGLLRRTRRWRALWQGIKEMLVAKPSRQASV